MSFVGAAYQTPGSIQEERTTFCEQKVAKKLFALVAAGTVSFRPPFGRPARSCCPCSVFSNAHGPKSKSFLVLFFKKEPLPSLKIFLTNPPHTPGLGSVVTVSIGAASTCAHGEFNGAACLLKDADTALYRAKALGRDAVIRATAAQTA